MMKFINETRRYPVEAYNNKVQGRVVCSFVVYPDGSINAISVIKGVEESLDREAVRIIQEMPRWMAGTIGEQPVPVSCVLTIPFTIFYTVIVLIVKIGKFIVVDVIWKLFCLVFAKR